MTFFSKCSSFSIGQSNGRIRMCVSQFGFVANSWRRVLTAYATVRIRGGEHNYIRSVSQNHSERLTMCVCVHRLCYIEIAFGLVSRTKNTVCVRCSTFSRSMLNIISWHFSSIDELACWRIFIYVTPKCCYSLYTDTHTPTCAYTLTCTHTHTYSVTI